MPENVAHPPVRSVLPHAAADPLPHPALHSSAATKAHPQAITTRTSRSSSLNASSHLEASSASPTDGLSPPQPPPPARRSSFGLNFLSSLNISMRPPLTTNNNNNNNNNITAADSSTFMSNSPTIANLNNYAFNASPHDEAIANGQRHLHLHREPVPPTTNATPTSSNCSVHGSEPLNSGDDNEGPHDDTKVIELHAPTTPPSTTAPAVEAAPAPAPPPPITEDDDDRANGLDKDGCFSLRLTPLIDHSTSASGLYFSPVIRKIKPDSSISIGRYTEKNKAAAHAPQGSSAPIVFKSKVVSRTHAMLQCNPDGQWFLKDCKSSSGTFLNHIRLSPASQESTLMPLLDGDIIQLGMDYRGGTEEVYRCVKMRCEFNKSWQRKVNQFNLEIHKKLKSLHLGDDATGVPAASTAVGGGAANGPPAAKLDDMSECAICLMKIEPCQALFLSPCSHAWHYKCIRPIIIKSYPQFYCPNCRTMCDLETDLDDDDD